MGTSRPDAPTHACALIEAGAAHLHGVLTIEAPEAVRGVSLVTRSPAHIEARADGERVKLAAHGHRLVNSHAGPWRHLDVRWSIPWTALPAPPCHLLPADLLLPELRGPARCHPEVQVQSGHGHRFVVSEQAGSAVGSSWPSMAVLPASYPSVDLDTRPRLRIHHSLREGQEARMRLLAQRSAEASPYLAAAFGPAPFRTLQLAEATSAGAEAIASLGLIAVGPSLVMQPHTTAGLYMVHETAHQWVGCASHFEDDDYGLIREGLPEAMQILFSRQLGNHRLYRRLRAVAEAALDHVVRAGPSARVEPWWQAAIWLRASDAWGEVEFMRRLRRLPWSGIHDGRGHCWSLSLPQFTPEECRMYLWSIR